MKKVITALALSIAFTTASAAEPVIGDWTRTDVALEVAVAATALMDYKQTMQIKNRPGLSESNPLLGHHPSDDRIRAYFIGSMVTHVLIVNALPPGALRTAFQVGTVAFELDIVRQNKRMGLKVKF